MLTTAFGLIATTGQATAAGFATGLISYYAIDAKGILYMNFDAAASGKPACSNGGFAISAKTPAGQLLMAGISSAKANQLTPSVYGTGTCTAAAGYENVAYVTIK